MLFPSPDFTTIQERFIREVTNEDIRISDIFDTLIKEKYLNNGYEFKIANYSDRPVYGITIVPKEVVTSNAGYDSFYRRNQLDIMEDYKSMAYKLNPNSYSEIVVGGYHIGDCVNKFASAIESISSAKVLIDGEVSNMFVNYGILNNVDTLNEDYVFYKEIKNKIDERNSNKGIVR